MILEHGFWAGLTLYPQTKISPQRAVDVIEKYGPERICVAGACDWGPSDPIAVPRFAMEMRRRKHPEALIQQVVFENPVRFLSQSPKFKVPAPARPQARPRGSADGDRRVAARSRRSRSTSPTARTSTPADGWDGVDRQHPPVRAGAEAAPLAVASVRHRPAAVGARRARAARRPTASTSSATFLDDERPLRRADQRLPARLVPSARRSRPTSTRPTGATRSASATRSISSPSSAGCCPTAWTAASRPRRCPTSPGSDVRMRRRGERSPRNVVRVAEALVRVRQRARHAHPPRHRARARLPDREQRRVPRRSSNSTCCPTAARCWRRRSAATLDEPRGAPARPRPHLLRLLPLRRRVRGSRRGARSRCSAPACRIGRVQLSSALKVDVSARRDRVRRHSSSGCAASPTRPTCTR